MMKKRKFNIVVAGIKALTFILVIVAIGVSINTYLTTSPKPTASIPVLLSSDASYWIDQHNKVMDDVDVERFFRNNPNYTRALLSLNNSPYYATNFQSVCHLQTINHLYNRPYLQDYDLDDLDASTYLAVMHDIIDKSPSDEAFQSLLSHVSPNGAEYDIKALMEYCTGESKTCTEQNVDKVATYVFFGTLAKYYAEELDTPCEASIPVVLSSDNKTWLDQNGVPMDGDEAKSFLDQNNWYAYKIACLNRNPYYLDTWYDDKREEAIWELHYGLFPPSPYDHNMVGKSYYGLLLQNAVEATSAEDLCNTLAKFHDRLKFNGEANNITKLMEYIDLANNNENGSYSLDENNLPSYIFWCTVAKITNDGTFKTSFEPAKVEKVMKAPRKEPEPEPDPEKAEPQPNAESNESALEPEKTEVKPKRIPNPSQKLSGEATEINKLTY